MINDFLKKESASGIILIGATILALIVANSPLVFLYDLLLELPVAVKIGAISIDKPLLLWINDGLMAVFFFLIGLELKREIKEGELSNPKDIVLPGIGAIGGMAVPAAIYVYFTWQDPVALQGWAIPAATDIAFALGIMALLGSRVPASLKVFLVTLAIIDDIGAILIIALFYTSNISVEALAVAAACLVFLFWMNQKGITQIPSYILVGVILWTALLKSGVHATLAGVALAFFIPMRDPKNKVHSPVSELEHSLHPSVSFVILPVFAFANAGIDLFSIGADSITHPVTIGILLGLVLGKPIGVFGLCFIAIKTKLAEMPSELRLMQLFGCSVLCGIGFTMSLFIGSLAFEETGVNLVFDERLGILAASFVSAITGYLLLWYGGRNRQVQH